MFERRGPFEHMATLLFLEKFAQFREQHQAISFESVISSKEGYVSLSHSSLITSLWLLFGEPYSPE